MKKSCVWRRDRRRRRPSSPHLRDTQQHSTSGGTHLLPDGSRKTELTVVPLVEKQGIHSTTAQLSQIFPGFRGTHLYPEATCWTRSSRRTWRSLKHNHHFFLSLDTQQQHPPVTGLQPSPVDQELRLLLEIQEVRQPLVRWGLGPKRFQEGREVQVGPGSLEGPGTAAMGRVRSGCG